MNRSELVQIVAKQANVDLQTVEDVLEQMIKVITLALAVDEDVLLRGFGKFRALKRAASTMRNPRNGAVVEVGERRTVSFAPSNGLKERLNAVPLS